MALSHRNIQGGICDADGYDMRTIQKHLPFCPCKASEACEALTTLRSGSESNTARSFLRRPGRVLHQKLRSSDYVYNVTINRTYDGYVREKSVVNDVLAKRFQDIAFEETDPELDHAGDIDYVAKVGRWQIGIQIKPVTAKANFGGFSLPERMKASFADFTEKYGGRVFVVYSLKGEIANAEVIDAISAEIDRLKANP